jgi:hypothetical protein
LRKLDLGIRAQASGKNLTRLLIVFGTPIRPRHLDPSSRQGVNTDRISVVLNTLSEEIRLSEEIIRLSEDLSISEEIIRHIEGISFLDCLK